MNESGFIRSVNQHLPDEVYRWKIADRFTAGVPDTWYSGAGGSLFIEYKLLKTKPANFFTPKLSKLQLHWLNNRYNEGVDVAVIIGMPRGGLFLSDLAWNGKVYLADHSFLSKKELAAHIKGKVINGTIN